MTGTPEPFRGPDRQAGARFRMSAEEKDRLKREAAEAGLTFQQLFELRMLGTAKPVGRDGRRPRIKRQDEELRYDLSA
jgi:hypothetical protein